jgi:hypothetical protein
MYKVGKYDGQWAVLDTRTRVWYYGFTSKAAAQKRANELNGMN